LGPTESAVLDRLPYSKKKKVTCGAVYVYYWVGASVASTARLSFSLAEDGRTSGAVLFLFSRQISEQYF
jgi:hypothetical protein